MPKIKLSGLVSDIKGKANGSVFARNNGGLYYRNNPSGGGQKTAKWAKAKAKFSSMSGKWRNLSPSEKLAWNNATSNYPTVNAFGDPRTPTGYELFMKLNQTLFNLGKPINTLPPIPKSFTSIGDTYLLTSDSFLFTPEHGYAPYNCQMDEYEEVELPGPCDDLDEDATDYEWENCWWHPSAKIINTFSAQSDAEAVIFSQLNVFNPLCVITTAEDKRIPINHNTFSNDYLNFYIVMDDPSAPILKFELKDLAAKWTGEFPIDPIEFGKPYRFTFVLNRKTSVESKAFIGAKEVFLLNETKLSDMKSLVGIRFDFIPGVDNNPSPSMIQHSVLSSFTPTLQDIGKIVRGYILPNMDYLFQYEPNKEGKFKNWGTKSLSSTSGGPVTNNLNNSFVKRDWGVSPWLQVTSVSEKGLDEEIIVNTSPMGSAGRTGTRSGFQRVAIVSDSKEGLSDVGLSFKENFGAVINDSFIQSNVQILNTSTGQLSAPTKIEFGYAQDEAGPFPDLLCSVTNDCPEGFVCSNGVCVPELQASKKEPKPTNNKNVKFKAGSELASSVN